VAEVVVVRGDEDADHQVDDREQAREPGHCLPPSTSASG
jgi:hypothetical protein